MVDVSLIAGAISGLRAASGMASDLVAVRDHAVLQSKVIDLQRTILDAQASALAAQGQINDLQETVRSLRAKLASAEGWDGVAGRYELREYDDQKFLYALKDEYAVAEPPHFLCTVCFLGQKRSILQRWSTHEDKICYHCQSCKNDFWLGKRVQRNNA